MNRHLGTRLLVLSQGQMIAFFFALCLLVMTNLIWLHSVLPSIGYDDFFSAVSAASGNGGGSSKNKDKLLRKIKASNDNAAIAAPSRDVSRGYDVIVVVHHDDMGILIKGGLQSFQDFLIDFDSDGIIYAVGTTQAVEILQSLKNNFTAADDDDDDGSSQSSVWSRLHLIHESIYPFSIADIKNVVQRKPTWNYQQLLKLYAHRALTAKGYKVRRHFLVIDADTILVNPLKMQEQTEEVVDGGRWFFCVASYSSGAFNNDCDIGPPLVEEALGPQFRRAFPHHEEERFTAICHHMLFDGIFVGEMLDHIERRFNKTKPWITLGTLKRSNLSEYELYLAYLMEKHREAVAVRPVPYVNWGRSDKNSLDIAKTFGMKYLTSHDDWNEYNICCVNSQWPSDSDIFMEMGAPLCPTCSTDKEEKVTHIDCGILGINGCKNVNPTEDGSYMIFEGK